MTCKILKTGPDYPCAILELVVFVMSNTTSTEARVVDALVDDARAAAYCIPGENPAEFTAFSRSFLQQLQPTGAAEEFLASEIVTTAWRLRRIPIIEQQMISEAVASRARTSARGPNPKEPNELLGAVYLDRADPLSRLARQESSLRRAFHESMKRLQRLQAERKRDQHAAEPAAKPMEKTRPVGVERPPARPIQPQPVLSTGPEAVAIPIKPNGAPPSRRSPAESPGVS
jgi:hypothetical protein